jgi:hypothetical protein
MYWFASWTVADRVSNIRETVDVMIQVQHEELLRVANLAAENRSETELEGVVTDCSIGERSRFFSLLGNLNQVMPRSDLLELETLFSRCGDYNAIHKSIVASRLKQEIEAYEDLTIIYEAIQSTDEPDTWKLDEWHKLSESERIESEAYADLVLLQEEIILALLEGAAPDSPEISVILKTVNETQQRLAQANIEASEARTALGVR